jgi:hypothetical protein
MAVCIYIERLRQIIHVILWCSKSCDNNKDEYDRWNGMWLWNHKNCWCHNMAQLVLATGLGNPLAFQVWTGKTIQFGSRTVERPNQQRLGGPNPDPYPSTRRFGRVCLDLSVPISGSVFRVFLSMVAYRYPTVNRKILTFAHHWPFQMNRPPS